MAISIFTMSILSVMAVLSSGISDTGYAKKKLIGGYLAQEGIEEMRNLRDTYMLYSSDGPTGWAAFITKLNEPQALCFSANGCYFDNSSVDFNNHNLPITDVLLRSCNDATCSAYPLMFDTPPPIGIGTGNYDYVRQIPVFHAELPPPPFQEMK